MQDKLAGFIDKKIWGPDPDSLGRGRAILLKAVRILYATVRDIYEGQLTLRAASLAYTTLVSLVPLLALSFSVLKAFGIHYQIMPFLYQFFAPLGPKGADITDKIIGFVDRVNAGVLGSLGIITLIYTAVSVVQKVEDSFNFIWRIGRARGLMRRFSDYISILLIGPVLIVSALGITASVMNTKIAQKILSIEIFGPVFYVAGKIVPYVIVSAAFTFAYSFIPNTKVNLRSALAGGVFAGILWQTSGWAFASFTASSKQYSAIYSGFAVIILFMIWIYLSWLIFLIGAVISGYHQHPQWLTAKKKPLPADSRPKERLALLVMFLIGYNYYHNKPAWTLDALADRLSLPAEPVLAVLTALTQRGLITETCGNPPAYLPARDIGTIKQKEVVDAVRADGASPPGDEACIPESEIDRVMNNIDRAIKDTLGEGTMKTLVLSCKNDRNA